MTILTATQHVLSKISAGFELTAALILTVMLGINAANIFLRSLFGNALDWVWPWTMFLFVVWVLIAFFPLYHLKKDVSIYFVLRDHHPKLQRALGVLAYTMISAAMLIILITGPSRLESARGIIEIVNLPRVALVIPLLLSASLIFVDAVVNLLLIATGKTEYVPFGKVEVTE